MKKIVMLVALAFALTTGLKSQADVADKILMYIPNRIIDATDLINMSLGFGPVIRAEGHITSAFVLGAGIGSTAEAIKGANRQYGVALEEGWDASFLCITAENVELESGSRWLQSFWHDNSGIPTPADKSYDFYEGDRSYWTVGGTAGVVVAQISAEIDVVEVADFLTGWIFIDLKGDDLTSEDL